VPWWCAWDWTFTLEMFSVCWDWVEDWAIHLGVMLSMFGLGRHSFLIFCLTLRVCSVRGIGF